MCSVSSVVKTILTNSEAETAAVGRELASTLTGGDVVLLQGDLGAGKTAFVRGLAEGLGIAPDEVSSPTFSLIQEYRGGRVPLFHVDLYRLQSTEVDDLGLDEIALGPGVTAIEWPERLPRPFEGAITVRLEHRNGDQRLVCVGDSAGQ